MIEPDQLWDVASSLLIHEANSEAARRRAVSACYYALFHAIAAAGAACFTGPGSLRNRIIRSYDHSAISSAAKDVEKRFQTNPLSSDEKSFLQLAQAFVRLQDARNRANYDLQATVTWEEADELWEEAGRALNALTMLPGQEFLVEFLLSPLLQRRRVRG